jgi:FkbM family methyltransferase
MHILILHIWCEMLDAAAKQARRMHVNDNQESIMKISNKIGGLREILRFDNWPELVLKRTCFTANPLAVYRAGGMDILVDHGGGDENGVREAVVSPMYRNLLAGLSFSAPINVMDLGANVGGFSLLLQLLRIPLMKVAAVEMNPNTFSRMRFNLERNLDCELALHNAAVCGEHATFKLSLGRGSTSDSLYSAGGSGKSYEIQGMTLDDVYAASFAGETVDLMKLDVEGAEYDILARPFRECLKQVKNLIIEIHPMAGRSPNEVTAALAAAGFMDAARSGESVFLYRKAA